MPDESDGLFERIKALIEETPASAQQARQAEQIRRYWLIGREIVDHERRFGRKRALQKVSTRLKNEGRNYSIGDLQIFRQLFLDCPDMLKPGPVPKPSSGTRKSRKGL